MMPLKNDENRNKAGLDPRYCSNCYVNDDFLVKGVSAKEFRDQVYAILCQQGWPKPMAWISTRGIASLPRWKQDNPDEVLPL